MKLIIGIGNPGKEYEGTRHNVGFMVLEELKKQILNPKFEILWQSQTLLCGVNKSEIPNYRFKTEKRFRAEVLKIGDVILAKPTTFMNDSGTSVASLYSYFKIHNSNLYVIHDDLDIHLGEYKIQKGVGPKLHYGIKSIDKMLGTNDYWRVRVGVDNREKMENGTWKMENFTKGEQYVLQKFTAGERKILDGVIEEAVSDIIEKVMK